MSVPAILTVLTIGAVYAVLAVGTVVDRHRLVAIECDRVTHDLAVFRHWGDACDVIAAPDGIDDRLHGREVGVHLSAQLFELPDPFFETVDALP